jgi:hypothetical protein
MRLTDYVTRDTNGMTTKQLGRTRTLLIGINSGQFDIGINSTERANLISIWFAEMILEILAANAR